MKSIFSSCFRHPSTLESPAGTPDDPKTPSTSRPSGRAGAPAPSGEGASSAQGRKPRTFHVFERAQPSDTRPGRGWFKFFGSSSKRDNAVLQKTAQSTGSDNLYDSPAGESRSRPASRPRNEAQQPDDPMAAASHGNAAARDRGPRFSSPGEHRRLDPLVLKHGRGNDAADGAPSAGHNGIDSSVAHRQCGTATKAGMSVAVDVVDTESTANPRISNVEAAADLALQNPGRVVEISLRHPWSSDEDRNATPVAQSTPDKVVRLLSPNEGEVTVFQAGKEARTFKVNSEHYKEELSSLEVVRNRLGAVMQNRLGAAIRYQPIHTKVLTSPESPRDLPGPPKEPRLTERHQRLIGVARWPDARFNQENSPGNQAYGLDFFKNVRNAGELIADRKINSFRELWHHSAEWRASKDTSDSPISDFAPSCPRGRVAITPLGGQYQYFRERIAKSRGTCRDPVLHGIRANVESFQQVGQIGAESIPLTCVKILRSLMFELGGHRIQTLDPEAARGLKAYRDLQYGGVADCLAHTDPKYIDRAIEHVETLFTKMTSCREPQEEKLKTLGEIHWWMANAMPDPRGSAAKAEFCVRSLACANGIELPPFKHGILPDLEAMDPRVSCADFVARYEQMFEWHDEGSAPMR